MSWEQDLVDAQISINRCVWAMNVEKPTERDFSGMPQKDYIEIAAETAREDLARALKTLKAQRRRKERKERS